MKHKTRNFLGILLIFFLILLLTCPSDSDYNKWLNKKHEIVCLNDGLNNCRQVVNGHDLTIDWASRHIRELGIYRTINDRYKDLDGNHIEIRSIGILGFYADY